MTAPTLERPIISDEDIARFGGRAADYDRENRFFSEDFEELRAAGYLKLPIPKDLGGHGMSVAEVAREQRRLAYRRLVMKGGIVHIVPRRALRAVAAKVEEEVHHQRLATARVATGGKRR